MKVSHPRMMQLFPRVARIFFLPAFLYMLVVLFLTVVNPRFKITEPSRSQIPMINLYVDVSASMFSHQERVENFGQRVSELWPGKVNIRFFSHRLAPKKTEAEGEQLRNQAFVDVPTFFTPVQESLIFAHADHFYAVVSDFIFRDGFSQWQGMSGLGTTNLFFIPPQERDERNVSPPRVAVSIRNTDNRILSDGSYPLKLLFYSDQPSKKLRYRIAYQTPDMRLRNTDRLKEVKVGSISTDDHYAETEIVLTFTEKWDKWLHLAVTLEGEEGYADRINLLPPREKKFIQMVYFEINRDVFAIKNSLDRYQDYQVETLYLGGRGQGWEVIQPRMEAMVANRDLFFLIAPPPEALRWFRSKLIPFVHIPKMSSPASPVMVGDLDFGQPAIDFMGESELSRLRWQQASPRLQSYPQALTSGDLPLHRMTGGKERSALFIRGKEMYWGIRNLFFLNDNILQAGEDSYWDVFLLKMMDFLDEKMGKKDTVQVSHNFFLGELVSNPSLPHVFKHGEVLYIRPELDNAGSYSSSQGRPPYNYRIPFEEYFPPPTPEIDFTSQERFIELIASIQNKELPQVVRELTFRELPVYGYLMGGMLALFLIILALKWYSNRLTS